MTRLLSYCISSLRRLWDINPRSSKQNAKFYTPKRGVHLVSNCLNSHPSRFTPLTKWDFRELIVKETQHFSSLICIAQHRRCDILEVVTKWDKFQRIVFVQQLQNNASSLLCHVSRKKKRKKKTSAMSKDVYVWRRKCIYNKVFFFFNISLKKYTF